MKKAYYIDDQEIDVGYQESEDARHYRLDTYGNSLESLVDNAVIVEVDPDGRELDCYDMWAAPETVQEKALKMIKNSFL